MDWCRLWHDAADDPKWRLIADKTEHREGEVWAIFTRMLIRASKASERGSIAGWNDDVESSALGFPAHVVTEIRKAMQGLILDGDQLINWEKRQPKREDNSTERVRAYRERKKAEALSDDELSGNAVKRDVTQCNATKRDETLDKRRGDKKEKNTKKESPTSSPEARSSRLPDDWVLSDENRAYAVERGVDADAEAENFRDYWHAKPGKDGRKLSWDSTWRTWVRRSAKFETSRPAKQKPEDAARACGGNSPFDAGTWQTRLRGYRPGRFWHADWGERPETGLNKLIPADVLNHWKAEHQS